MKLYGILYGHETFIINNSKTLIRCLECKKEKTVDKGPEQIKGEFIHKCISETVKVPHHFQVKIDNCKWTKHTANSLKRIRCQKETTQKEM